jgi:hypothetical protein
MDSIVDPLSTLSPALRHILVAFLLGVAAPSAFC